MDKPGLSLFGMPISMYDPQSPGSATAASGPAPVDASSINALPDPTVIPAGSSTPTPAPGSDHYVEHNPHHMGAAGVARDILGTLGDFLLTRLHMPAMYAPAQHQRQLEAAVQGFDTDPLGAINRVTDVDYTAGSHLRDQFIDNQRAAAQQSSTMEARNTRLQLAQTAQNDRTRARAASMLGTMATWDDSRRQQNYGAMRQQVLNYGTRNGLDLSSELPDSYDSNALDAFIQNAVPVGMQGQLRLGNDKLDESTRHHGVTEGIQQGNLSEKIQHDRADESIGQANVGERGRHDVVTESLGQGNLDERGRHDYSTEQDNTANRVQRGQIAGRRDQTVRRGQDMRRPPAEGERRMIGGRVYVWTNGRAVLQ